MIQIDEETLIKWRNNDKLIKMAALSYIENYNWHVVEELMGLERGFFQMLFIEAPDIEQRIDDEIMRISEREADRINAIALPHLLKQAFSLSISGEVDEQLILKATSTHLQYYGKKIEKSKGEKTDVKGGSNLAKEMKHILEAL